MSRPQAMAVLTGTGTSSVRADRAGGPRRHA